MNQDVPEIFSDLCHNIKEKIKTTVYRGHLLVVGGYMYVNELWQLCYNVG